MRTRVGVPVWKTGASEQGTSVLRHLFCGMNALYASLLRKIQNRRSVLAVTRWRVSVLEALQGNCDVDGETITTPIVLGGRLKLALDASLNEIASDP